MKKFTKTAIAAAFSLSLASSVLTSTTMHAAAWGWEDGDGGNTWWAIEESHNEANTGVLGDTKSVGDSHQDEFSWWAQGDDDGGNTWW